MAQKPVDQAGPDTASRERLGLILAVIFTVVLWASAFAGIRAGLRSYSPESVALLRYLTASAALAVYALVTRMPLPARKDLPGIALMGFLGFTFYNVALNAGEQQIPAGTAALIVATAPIFVALLARIFFHEHLKAIAWVGILISFVGVGIISFESQGGFQLSFAALLVLSTAISSSIYSVAQKSYLKRYSPLQFTAYAIWAGTAFLLVFTPGLVSQIQTATTEATLAVIYMGIFPGVIGYACWAYVLSRIPAAKAGSFLYLVPPTATLIAWIWLGELPAVTALIGGVFVLGGVIIVNLIGRR
jgi:drug/metabolite transporter (DMT)-like permease